MNSAGAGIRCDGLITFSLRLSDSLVRERINSANYVDGLKDDDVVGTQCDCRRY
jgi:hypothetical protein